MEQILFLLYSCPRDDPPLKFSSFPFPWRPDYRRKGDPKHWLDLLEAQSVTVWNTAPPVMTMLLDYVASSFAARERFSRLPLRLVLLSGDFIPLKTAPTLKQLLPNNVSVISLGGATEASIWSCYYEIGELQPEWKRFRSLDCSLYSC